VSQCTGPERYQYGKALLLSMGLRRLPAVPAFFGNGKGRFVMLGRHRKSRLSTVLGLSTCVFIGGGALTSAPVSIAQQVEDSVSGGPESPRPSAYRFFVHDGELRSLTAGHRLIVRDGFVRSLPEGGGVVLLNGEVYRLPEEGGIILLKELQ